MKTRITKGENIQIGDSIIRKNVLGQKVALLVTDVAPGDYMQIDYEMHDGTTWQTHFFSDEQIEILA